LSEDEFIARWEQLNRREELELFLQQAKPLLSTKIILRMKARSTEIYHSDSSQAIRLVESLGYAAQLTGQPLDLISALIAASNAARWQAQYQQVVKLCDEAAQVARSINNDLEAARAQISKVFALSKLGQYAQAVQAGEAARKVLLAHQEFLPVLSLDTNLAGCYYALADYEQAATVYQQSLEVLARLQATEPSRNPLDLKRRVATTLYELSLVLTGQNQYQAALQKATQAAQIQRELGNLASAAKYQVTIGYLNLKLGHFNKALRLLDEAREYCLTVNARDFVLWADLYMVQSYLALNRFSPAVERCQSSLKALQSDNRHNSKETGVVNQYLGVALAYLGRQDEALAAFEQARQIFALIGTGAMVANPTLDQAEYHYTRQEYAATEKLCLAARTIFRQQNLLANGARCDVLLGKVRLAQGQLAEACELAGQAEATGRTAQTPLVVYQALLLQAEIAEKQGDKLQALARYRASLEAVEEMRGKVAAEARATFIEDKEEAYQGAVAVSLETGAWLEALELVERGKSRGLIDLLAGGLDVRVRVRSENDRELVENHENLRSRRNELVSRLANWSNPIGLSLRGTVETAEAVMLPDSQRLKLVSEVKACEGQMRELVERLQVRNAAYAEDVVLQPPETQLATEYLEADTVLVEYYICRGEVLAFVVNGAEPKKVTVVRQLANDKEINRYLVSLRSNLASVAHILAEPLDSEQRARRIKNAGVNARAILQKLYGQLIAPLAAYLKSSSKLIIVPHGLLHYLPFHAFYDRVSETYLLQEWEAISYLPSGSLLKFCQRRGQRSPTEQGRGSLIMGYSNSGNLAHCLSEAQTVDKLLTENGRLGESKLYQEADATIGCFEAEAGHRQLIHLATHGQFRQDEPLFSSLLLAGGELTAQDLFNFELRASLVTFSACETGLGRLGGGDELMGLSRACLYAGASSLVLSLWRVEDESVARLMEHFYTRLLAGVSKGAALRQAQIALLQNEAYTHPFFWAAFVLIGHSGSL